MCENLRICDLFSGIYPRSDMVIRPVVLKEQVKPHPASSIAIKLVSRIGCAEHDNNISWLQFVIFTNDRETLPFIKIHLFCKINTPVLLPVTLLPSGIEVETSLYVVKSLFNGDIQNVKKHYYGCIKYLTERKETSYGKRNEHPGTVTPKLCTS